MAEEIKIEIDVEDSTAMAKLAELQAQLDKMGGPEPGSAGSMKAGIRVGQWFPEQLEQMASAGGRYKQVLDQVTGSTNEVSEATGKAGINIESMMTRMATRMAIMEVARLAIGALVNAFKEMAAIETARVNFENLTIAMENASEVEERLTRTTFDTNIAFEKLSPAIISLEDAGEGPRAAADDVDSLAKRAAATGDDVNKLATALRDVRLNEATVPEMFELAHASGTAKDGLVSLVTQYAELERSIKVADHARAESLIVMDEQVRAEERLIDAGQRAADIASKAAEKQIADWERVSAVRESFLEKVLAAEGKPPGQADPLLVRAMQPGGLPQTAGGKQMTADIAAGFQRIYDEENLTTQGMQHFVDTGQIGLREILAAAKRLHEAEKEARTDAAEKNKQMAEDRKRALAENLQDAKKEETETKRAEKVQLDTARLNIENQIAGAIQDQSNIADELNKKMGTTAEQLKTIGTAWKSLWDSGFGKVVSGGIANISGFAGVGEVATGIRGVAQQFFPETVANDAKRTADATETIANALTGKGTP
jgi:hypothetical protein